jgi:Cu/Ag efflux pump CusA
VLIGSILRASLRFRVLLVGLAAGLIVLGAISLRQMHNDVLPELSNGPVLEVQTEALGLSSQEVEQYITVPMENNLLDGVMGVWDVRSQSIPGLSTVDLYFEPGTTTLHARQLVEERLTNAFSLPNVAKPPLLIQPLSSTSRAMMIGLRSSTVNPLELSYLARWVVKPRLAGVPGVANVAIFGQQDRQIQVQVDPARLASHHVTLQQVINTAGNAQLVSPLSYLEGSTPGTGGFLDQPNQRLEIRPVLPLGAPKLATVPITGAPGKLPLGAVANVLQSHQPMIGDALGTHGTQLVLLVQKLPSASVVGVTKGVDRALADLAPALHGVKIDTSFFRPATYVSSSLSNLAVVLYIAIALALIALTALFMDLRATFVAAVSVAISLVAAALLLQALGYTLNVLIVLGLLVASGVVVDDAVSATHEIIHTRRERAADGTVVPIEVVVMESCSQLRSTLGFATLIVLLAVVPVFVSHGLTATYLHPMALSFALAVIASALVAMTVTPAMGMLMFDRPPSRRFGSGIPERVIAVYGRLVRATLAIPATGLAVVCLVGLVGFFALPFLHQPAPPRFQDRNLVVQWNGPPGASLKEMNRITGRTIATLRSLPPVSDVAATLGRAVSGDRIVDTSSGQIYVALKRDANYDQATALVAAVVRSVPGIHASVSTYEADVQSGVLSPARHDVTVRVYGQDYAVLRGLAKQVQSLMGGIGLQHAQMTMPATEPNISVTVNDAAAHNAGVAPGDVRRAASTLVSGLTVGNFFQDQAVFDVVVMGSAAVRQNIDAVRNLLINTGGGGHVPLSKVANVAVRSDPIDIQHEALSRYIDVTAPVSSGSAGAIASSLGQQLSSLRYPLDYHAEVLGSTPDAPTSHAKFLSFVVAAALAALLLFQAAFRSWRLAAMFMLVLPVTLLGGLIAALISGEAQSLGTDAGLLGVLALAVRLGMLQIGHLRRLHAATGGHLNATIVVSSAAERFGGTMTSVLVLAAGLIPFAVRGDVAGNEITHTAALVMLGGLLSTLIVNVILLPAMCLSLGPADPVRLELEEEPAHTSLTAPSASQS